MSALLELNIRAKRATPVPPKVTEAAPNGQPMGSLMLEDGKKYITNGGEVLTIKKMNMPNRYWADGWYDSNGIYVGFPDTHPKTIRMEWFPTWKEYDAWIGGQAIETCPPQGDWMPNHSYKTVCNAFGVDSEVVRTWWATYFDQRVAHGWAIRIAP